MIDQPALQPLVVLFGGSGFLGQHTAHAFALKGWRVRIVSRHPQARKTSTTHVEYMKADVMDGPSVEAALSGASAVVNLTGILSPTKDQNFDQVHRKGSEIISSATRKQDIQHFVQISAIGADSLSSSVYARSKAAGEEAVLSHLPHAVILRPSIIFGPEDSFFNRFSAMARFLPALPLIGGGRTVFQPVFVGDVAQAIICVIEGHGQAGKIYELGGPDKRSFADLLRYICRITHRRRLLITLPFFMAKIVAFLIEATNALLFGHLPAMLLITRDQVELLRSDNIVSKNASTHQHTLEGLGITPQSIEAIVPHYLVR
jgi:NADH dehydrogenase